MADYNDSPTISVYCEGPTDAEHPREPIERYRRVELPGGHVSWFPTSDRTVVDLIGDEPQQHPPLVKSGYRSKLRFHCLVCRFDEKRGTGTAQLGTYEHMSEFLERLHHAGVRDVSVRALVDLVWGAKRRQ